MRFFGILFAVVVTAFAAAEDVTVTLAPTDNGNDQDALDSFLGQEPETEAVENAESFVDELPPPEGEEIFPEDEEEELPEEETPEDIDEGEDVDVVDEEETPETEELDLPEEDEATKPPKHKNKEHDEEEEPAGDETQTETPETPEEEDVDFVDEDEEETEKEEAPTGIDWFKEEEEKEEEEEEEVLEEPDDLGEDEGDFPFPSEDEFDTEAPTPLPQPRFTPSPTVYAKPSLRPVSPYVSTDDDPLKNDSDEAFSDWGFNEETVNEIEKDVEEMAHDTKVVIALSTVFGLMFFFAVFVAYQMLEKPNGICASLCRITVAFWCGLLRCVCWPCRKMCGCTDNDKPNREDHMMLANDGHFTHDLELS